MSATKVAENTTNIFQNCFFRSKFKLCHFKPNIYISKTKFVFHKQYLFRFRTSRKATKTLIDQSIPRVALLCLKRNDLQIFKRGSSENFFL